MVLCIIPPNVRLIAEILKELGWERRSERTDGRMDIRAQGPTTIPVGPMAAKGNKIMTCFNDDLK